MLASNGLYSYLMYLGIILWNNLGDEKRIARKNDGDI